MNQIIYEYIEPIQYDGEMSINVCSYGMAVFNSETYRLGATPGIPFPALRQVMIDGLPAIANGREIGLTVQIFNYFHFQNWKSGHIEILHSTYRKVLRIEKPITTSWFPHFAGNGKSNLA